MGPCDKHPNCTVKALVGEELGPGMAFPEPLKAHAAREFPGYPCLAVEHIEGQLGITA